MYPHRRYPPALRMTARRATLILLLTALCAAPATGVAVAQQDPFGPVPQAPPQQPPPAPAPAGQDEGLSRTQELLIGAAGLVLLLGIGWAIVRDAREAAPVDADHPIDEIDKPKGTRPPPERRVKQNRARAKAARQARKRNR